MSAWLLSACSLASQVEDQAYVLVMGLDRSNSGGLEMSVQIPRISGSQDGNSGGSKENYIKMSIKGEDFDSALERLDWATPRDLNLAQLKLIVLSRDLAEDESCGPLIESIAQTERLFTATKVTVCEGSAKEFVEAIQPFVGTRISTDINAMFDHYQGRGYVPESSLGELFYRNASVYSDPMVSHALLDQKSAQLENAVPASALAGSSESVSSDYESAIPTRYLGAAVFSGGSMCGVLDGQQTIFAGLLRNEIQSFRYDCDGQSLEIVPTRACLIKVDLSSEPIRITIRPHLSYASQERRPNESILRTQITNDIIETVHAAQRMGAEPFGFSETAARKFLTMNDWLSYNWIDAFRNAEIHIDLKFARSDT